MAEQIDARTAHEKLDTMLGLIETLAETLQNQKKPTLAKLLLQIHKDGKPAEEFLRALAYPPDATQ